MFVRYSSFYDTLLLSLSLVAAEIYIDVNDGNDHNAGTRSKPLRNWKHAIRNANPGDTIIILPAGREIRGNFSIRNLKGTVDKPITIDGSFNIFNGSAPVRANWSLSDPDRNIYHRHREKVSPSFLNRYAMSFNGKLNRMGRHTKWKGKSFKVLSDLQPYEWTVVNKNDFYFRLPPNQTPEQEQVEETVLESGVAIFGECAFITVRNIIVTRFWNDGYNLHHDCRNILLENIAAIENCDDGISAHETCQAVVKNFLSIDNGTGLGHIQQAEVEHENVYIAGADSQELRLQNKFNSLKNVVIEGTSPGGLSFLNGKQQLIESSFINCKHSTNTHRWLNIQYPTRNIQG